MHSFTAKNGQTVYYVGEPLKKDRLPAIFYFALSAKESLLVDPFNQMVEKLKSHPLRIFSVDLPFHGENFLATEALGAWAEQVKQGIDPLTPFFETTAQTLSELYESGFIAPDTTAAAGLSRGAFVATEMAARLSWLKNILGFAPLTQLKLAKEFHSLADSAITRHHNLMHKIDTLTDKTIRFYISHRDMRVGTKDCFEFIYGLCEKAHEDRIRSAPIELFIKPPIGHLGHGTSQETFLEGAQWLLSKLGLA
jgi:esterase FrsA